MANAGRGELLWEPSAESVERSTMTRYMRWLATERGRAFDDYQALWEWSVRELEEFWASIWDFFEVRALGAVLTSPGRSGDARRELVRGREAELRRARVPRQARGPRGGLPRLRAPRARRAPLGRASGAGRAHGGRAARPRRRAGRPCRRLHAQHPGDADRLSRDRLHRGHLVELLPGLRRRERRRPLRPDRAQGALLRRRLPLQRQGFRPDRHRRRPAARDADPGAHGRRAVPLPRSGPLAPRTGDPLGRAPRHRGGPRAELRAGPGRSPALGALLVGDDRPAEGHRPGTRRDPPRAPQEAEPAPRRAGG